MAVKCDDEHDEIDEIAGEVFFVCERQSDENHYRLKHKSIDVWHSK
jgi:hypothetical protein